MRIPNGTSTFTLLWDTGLILIPFKSILVKIPNSDVILSISFLNKIIYDIICF